MENCQTADTANYVREFAANNTAWLEVFGQAFQILIENGYKEDDLYETGSGTTTVKALLLITAATFAVTAILSLPY